MENPMKILIVEDEPKIVEVIKAYLQKEAFEILIAEEGEKALTILRDESVHLVILDLMLPKLSGEDVCKKIRSTWDTPIIMLTAKSEEEEKLNGLALGADDYITKPFSPRELVGRVHALLRRTYRDSNTLADYLVFNDGDVEIDIKKQVVRKRGKMITLTVNEFKLLYVFLMNPGQVLSRDQLLEKAFGFDYIGFDRTVDTHIKNIRQKIEDDPKKPVYIHTVYGAGYKFGGSK